MTRAEKQYISTMTPEDIYMYAYKKGRREEKDKAYKKNKEMLSMIRQLRIENFALKHPKSRYSVNGS